jgi:ribosomal protein L40E
MKINKNHQQKKTIIRILGILSLTVGIILTIISITDIISPPSTSFFMEQEKSRAGLGFIGLPLIFIGSALTFSGYMGEVARYQAQEMAPVKKDVFNYMADGTKEGIKTITKSIFEGLNGESLCPQCHTKNDADAKFCDNCGKKIITTKECPYCNAKNDSDAQYCDNCGERI